MRHNSNCSAIPDGELITVKSRDSVYFPMMLWILIRSTYYPHPVHKLNSERFLDGDMDNSIYMPFVSGPEPA